MMLFYSGSRLIKTGKCQFGRFGGIGDEDAKITCDDAEIRGTRSISLMVNARFFRNQNKCFAILLITISNNDAIIKAAV